MKFGTFPRRPFFFHAPDGNEGGGDPATQEKPEPVEFTPSQQAKLQELINQAHGKAYGKAQAESNARIQALEAELSKLKGGNKPEKPEPKGYDEEAIKKLLEGVRGEYEPKLTAATQQIEQLKTHQRTAAIVTAAAKAKAVDPEVVATLVSNSIGFDEEHRLVVLDANGQPRLNRQGEPMDVEEYVRTFLDDRPYLKQAANNGGAGSGTKPPAGSQPAGRPKNWNDAASAFAQTIA